MTKQSMKNILLAGAIAAVSMVFVEYSRSPAPEYPVALTEAYHTSGIG